MLDRGIYPVIFVSLYVWFDELEVELRSWVWKAGNFFFGNRGKPNPKAGNQILNIGYDHLYIMLCN